MQEDKRDRIKAVIHIALQQLKQTYPELEIACFQHVLIRSKKTSEETTFGISFHVDYLFIPGGDHTNYCLSLSVAVNNTSTPIYRTGLLGNNVPMIFPKPITNLELFKEIQQRLQLSDEYTMVITDTPLSYKVECFLSYPILEYGKYDLSKTDLSVTSSYLMPGHLPVTADAYTFFYKGRLKDWL